jgi:hypothetical protein
MVQTRQLSDSGMGLAIPENYLIREEPIRRLEPIVFALWQAARRDPESDQTKIALRAALSARCARCGMVVTGEELIALSQLPANEESARLQRLRQGKCARQGCQFDHYHITFQNHPDLDWTRLLGSGGSGIDEPMPSSPPEDTKLEETAPPTNAPRVRRALIRLGILIAIAMALYVSRQLYFGGRIPIVREPEKFKVAPAPPGGEKNPQRKH